LPGAIGLLLLSLIAGVVNYTMTRPNAVQNISAQVNIGSIHAPHGTVTITAVKIEEGDSEAERERKIATARSLLSDEIVFNLRSLDSRIGLARATAGPQELGDRLRAGMRDVAPVVAEVNATAYAQLLSQQAAASLRQAFASAPLRGDLTDFVLQLVTTANAPTERVHEFYKELNEAAYRADVVLETLDMAARKPDALARSGCRWPRVGSSSRVVWPSCMPCACSTRFPGTSLRSTRCRSCDVLRRSMPIWRTSAAVWPSCCARRRPSAPRRQRRATPSSPVESPNSRRS
jgi:hypothetical protein